MSHFEARPRASYDKPSPAWAAGATLALAMHWVAEVLAATIPAMAATAQLGLGVSNRPSPTWSLRARRALAKGQRPLRRSTPRPAHPGGLVLGSVAQRLIRQSPMSVLVVRDGQAHQLELASS